MSNIFVIGTSPDPDSRSQRLAQKAVNVAETLGHTVEYLDLRETPLPMAGPADSWDDPRVKVLQRRLEQHHRIILAVPICNVDVNAAAKNWLELVGGKWLEDAAVGFICAAGGRASYMSVMGFANALQLDFRAWIVPRFVYVTDNQWNHDEPNADVLERIHGLVKAVVNGPKRGE